MDFFRNIFSATIIKTGDFLLGGHYLNSLKEWSRYNKMSEKKLLEIQGTNLASILTHTKNSVPFYKDFFNNQDINDPIVLKDFPILTKSLLREQKENLISDLFSVEKLQKNYSSGSSGLQSFSYTEKHFKYYLQGLQTNWYTWTGYRIGDPVMQFGISPSRVFPKNFKDYFYNVHYLNSFTLNEKDLLEASEILKKKRIEYLIGYPSAINELAKVLIQHNKSYPIKGIISLGDKLFNHFKKNFDEAFQNPKINDTYGCAEGLLIACSNDYNYYYVMAPNVFVEIVDDEGNEVPDGTMGHVLITSLKNYAMPMIRYKLGDLAIKLPREKYPENRLFQYPMLERIVGRETDVVKTLSGKTLIVHSFTGIFEFYSEIKQFKIIQSSLNKITVEYILDENFKFDNTTLTEIANKIDDLTDKDLTIEFKKVDTIKNSPSGKPQIIESLIPTNEF